jgi:FkbM family methyltransferase
MLKDIAESLLPQDIYKSLKRVYKENITEYKRDIYSEFGEDFIAAVLLSFKKDGFFVDVGAFRPKELSVTYYFYRKLNWNGLIVEPNPKAVKEFQEQRPKDKMINKGVAKEAGELTYYKFTDPTLNSFDPETFKKNESISIGTETIPVEPLSKILEENVPAGKQIDLMNIDVEGLDLQALESNNWDKFSPTVIIIEDHKFQPENPMESQIVQFLKEKGYTLKANCLISLVFQKQ